MPGAARTGPERALCAREDRKRSGNAADGRSWTASPYPAKSRSSAPTPIPCENSTVVVTGR